MRIIKFNESVNQSEIEDLLYDFKDEGFEVECDIFEGQIFVTGHIDNNIDRFKFVQDVLDLNSRITSLGYDPINDKFHIYTGYLDGKSMCRFSLKYKDNQISANKDVKSFEEFKQYIEKVLDLNFYEWDSEVYIPDLDDNREYQRTSSILKLDVNKTPSESGNIPAGFTIVFEKGSLNDFISPHREELSELVMTDEEWLSVNLWSARSEEKERLENSEIQKRASKKLFGFDKRGIEAVEKCIRALKKSN